MTDTTDLARGARPDDGRYGTIETGDGATIIYDREARDAWLQSSLLVDCEV